MDPYLLPPSEESDDAPKTVEVSIHPGNGGNTGGVLHQGSRSAAGVDCNAGASENAPRNRRRDGTGAAQQAVNLYQPSEIATKDYVDKVTNKLEQKMEDQRNDCERQLDAFRVQVQEKDALIQSLQTQIMDLQLELQRSRDECSNERAKRTAIENLYKELKKQVDDNAESYKQRMETLDKEINQWVLARGKLIHETKLAQEEREYVRQYLDMWKRSYAEKDKYIEWCRHELQQSEQRLQQAKEIMAKEVTKTWEEMEK